MAIVTATFLLNPVALSVTRPSSHTFVYMSALRQSLNSFKLLLYAATQGSKFFIDISLPNFIVTLPISFLFYVNSRFLFNLQRLAC